MMQLPAPGRYRVAVRYSPYWHAAGACLGRGPDGMLQLVASHAGRYRLQFAVDGSGALDALTGDSAPRCGPG